MSLFVTNDIYMYFLFSEFEDFLVKLNDRVPHLHLWAARVYHDKIPDCITDRFHLTKPLRCPAFIVSEIQKSLSAWRQLLQVPVGLYSEDLVQPCEGPTARTLRHQGDQHSDTLPHDCEACGRDLAALLEELHVNGILLIKIHN